MSERSQVGNVNPIWHLHFRLSLGWDGGDRFDILRLGGHSML